MKNAIKLFLFIFLLLSGNAFAQDVQELYEDAKNDLRIGNYQDAISKIEIARLMIEQDPNLDPGQHFSSKLLPKIDKTARQMKELVDQLRQIETDAAGQLEFTEQPVSVEAVGQYAQQAQDAGSSLLRRRDSLLSEAGIDPEYREALRNLPVYKQIDRTVSLTIPMKLAEKFAGMAGELTTSLNDLNQKFAALTAELDKMKKSAVAGRAERLKLEKELAEISEQRLNFMNSISEMLVGEATAENQELRSKFLDNNVENIFAEVIRSETQRLSQITEIDSAGYKEMMKNYQRIANYNRIFLRNNISSDQTQLLAQYEAAVARITVTQKTDYSLIYIAVISLAVLIIVVLLFRAGKKRGERGDDVL